MFERPCLCRYCKRDDGPRRVRLAANSTMVTTRVPSSVTAAIDDRFVVSVASASSALGAELARDAVELILIAEAIQTRTCTES